MLHVLLLILKIIGWILLGILGLLLLLVLAVLFSPIRYRADASYQGGKTLYIKAKVRYLIFSIRVLYDQSREAEKLEQEIRLLWFRLGKKKEESSVDHLKEDEADDAWEDDADALWDDGEIPTIELPKKEPESHAEEDVPKKEPESHVEEDVPEPEPEPVFDLDEPDDLPENEKKRSGRFRVLCRKLWDKCKKLWKYMKNHTPEKLVSRVTETVEKKTSVIKKKIRRLRKFWNLSCTVKTREYLKRYIPKTMKHILPRRIKGHVHYGMDEPYKTGQVTGYLSLLPFMYQKGLSLQPDFEQKVLDLDVDLKGRIRLGYLLRIGLNRNVWRTIKVAKKVMNQ